MIFKEIETDQEWSEAIALRNIHNWSNPVSVAEVRSRHQISSSQKVDVRFIGHVNSKSVLYGSAVFNSSANDGTYWFGLSYDPSEPNARQTFQQGIEEAVRTIQSHGGTKAMIESRGEVTWEKTILKELGFSFDMRLPITCLEISTTSFELNPSVVSCAQFLAENPEDGMHRLWRLEMEVANDLPLPYPFVETPFEAFATDTSDPEVDLNSQFLYVEDGDINGMSQLWPSKVNPKSAQTGLTGVRRAYRRQGIATKTKQHSIAWAKAQGIEKIYTDNEENNPMYQLNLQLGFHHLFDFEVYSKSC